MRSIFTAVFVAALVAVPTQSKAAPRSIDDCEIIQAADAYNQCLALFGPLARGHGGDSQDAAATPGNANARVAMAGDSGHEHGARHASRHRWTRHRWARHGHWHRTRAAAHQHGKTTTLAFSVVSGHTRLR
ncbi:MAG: hypothetical protein WBE80_13350 [Methylocella sp.]